MQRTRENSHGARDALCLVPEAGQDEGEVGGGVLLKTSLNFSPPLGDLQLFSLAVAAEILPTIKGAALPQ